MARKTFLSENESDPNKLTESDAEDITPNSSHNSTIRPSTTNSEFREFADFQASLGISGGVIEIHRKAPNTAKHVYVISVPVEEFRNSGMLETIKLTFGGGDYLFKPKGSNGVYQGRQFMYSIDPRFFGSMDKKESSNQGMSPEVMSQFISALQQKIEPKADATLQVLSKQQEKSDQMMMMFITMMNKSQETMAQIMAQSQQSMTNTLMTILPLMMNKNDSSKDLLAPLMGFVTDNLKHKALPANNINDTLLTIKNIKELFGNEAPQNKSMVEKLLEMIVPSISTAVAAKTMGVPLNVSPQAPADMPPLAEAFPQVQPFQPPYQTQPQPEQDMNFMQRMIFNHLLDAAEKNNNPMDVYNDAIDKLTDDQFEKVVEFITPENWFEKIEQITGNNPLVAKHKEWLAKLREIALTPDE